MTRAAVGFGANLGRPDVTFADALAHLDHDPAIRILKVSSLYRSAPWGLDDQGEFLNGAALIATELSPRALLGRLQEEEFRAGRTRDVHWGPRTLDLDLLWYGDVVCSGESLALPHPRLPDRTFVLRPLAEIDPFWRHPVTHRSVGEMLAKLEGSMRATGCRKIEEVSLGETLEVGSCPS
jgi:2-amino-4-hydroxy-6-hydroxymethyldihydropteridine diphosphokinase